jgi:hypothetical protein
MIRKMRGICWRRRSCKSKQNSSLPIIIVVISSGIHW